MDLLDKKNVRIVDSAADWKEAIIKSVLPLEEGGFVKSEYKYEIIARVEELGPYIIVAPRIALPHARPEQGVVKSQIAITLFRKAVSFDKADLTAQLFITLAAADSSNHLNTLVAISQILQEQEKVNKILEAKDAETLYSFFV